MSAPTSVSAMRLMRDQRPSFRPSVCLGHGSNPNTPSSAARGAAARAIRPRTPARRARTARASPARRSGRAGSVHRGVAGAQCHAARAAARRSTPRPPPSRRPPPAKPVAVLPGGSQTVARPAPSKRRVSARGRSAPGPGERHRRRRTRPGPLEHHRAAAAAPPPHRPGDSGGRVRSGQQPARRRRDQRTIALLAGPAPEGPAPQPVCQRRSPAAPVPASPPEHGGRWSAPATELAREAPPSRRRRAPCGESCMAGGNESTGWPRNAPPIGTPSSPARYQSPGIGGAPAFSARPLPDAPRGGAFGEGSGRPLQDQQIGPPRRAAQPPRSPPAGDRPWCATGRRRGAHTPEPAAGRPRAGSDTGTGCPSPPARRPARRRVSARR